MIAMRNYKDTDDKVSLLGFGLMRLPKIDPVKSDIDKEKTQEMIDYAYSHGVNYFDTAYPYHEGKSELFVGEAMKKYPRESFHLASKMPVWLVEKPSTMTAWRSSRRTISSRPSRRKRKPAASSIWASPSTAPSKCWKRS